MPKRAEPNVFTCRICGHNEFREVRADDMRDIVIGAPVAVKYCQCKGCSVLFSDPEIFSKTHFNRAVAADVDNRGEKRKGRVHHV